MTKKRGSLKGKGMGSPEEKGRGIDALFGASAAEDDDTDAGNLVIDATPESTTRGAASALPHRPWASLNVASMKVWPTPKSASNSAGPSPISRLDKRFASHSAANFLNGRFHNRIYIS